jgi:hypothetical protein
VGRSALLLDGTATDRAGAEESRYRGRRASVGIRSGLEERSFRYQVRGCIYLYRMRPRKMSGRPSQFGWSSAVGKTSSVSSHSYIPRLARVSSKVDGIATFAMMFSGP